MADLRMPDLNKVFLAGNLTHDPELKYLPNGNPLCKLRLAVSRKYRTKDGDMREDTLFINITVWGRSAEYCGENLKKGRPVLVEGRLHMNEWEDKNSGQKRTMIEVTAVRVQQLAWEDRAGTVASGAGSSRESDNEPESEDDIPF